MAKPYLLLAPGPVQLHPKVQKALALPMIHHRTPLFDEIFNRVKLNLKKIFQTQQNCYMLSSTGSGGMECLMANTLNPNDKVLVVNSGKFGERWGQMAQAHQLKVIELMVPWGKAVDPKDVLNILETEKQSTHPVRAVFCQATETSTTVAHPIKEIGKIVSQFSETLFLVDGITALGAYKIPMDQWHIDGLVGGSQKAFMLPTGMCFVAFSEKAWDRIPSSRIPRYYFDIREEEKANKKGETWFSSNVTLIRALDVVLNMILADGYNSHLKTISRRAQFTRHFTKKLGLKLATDSPSLSVTGVLMPNGVDGQEIRRQLEEKHQITVMGGQDQWKGKLLRIGHMGHIEDEAMIRLFLDLQKVLPKNSFKPVSQVELKKWLKQQH